ncbi:MAG TPA: zf-HC2 domain-containing protein [Terriglobales bacterium]|jgi:anti-sigma factor RsiW|nr:zf-HC2 domain-containing protein [Terriglobales bacterium]
MNKKQQQPHKNRPRPIAHPVATCRDEITVIGDYLSGDMTANQHSAFEAHLKICEDCLAFLETYRKTIELTRRFLHAAAAHPESA